MLLESVEKKDRIMLNYNICKYKTKISAADKQYLNLPGIAYFRICTIKLKIASLKI